MPPKRKRTTSAYRTHQAKKRKRNQRQREQQSLGSLATSELITSEERRRERDAVAHRLARLNRPRRQQEQERNTATRRQLRAENLQRRSEEQVKLSSDILDGVTF